MAKEIKPKLKPVVKVPEGMLNKLFSEFFETERIGGLALLVCTILSIVVANGSAGEAYTSFWDYKIDLSFAWVSLDYSIEYWINDGLMAVFFLMIGLEIERELYVGELKSIKNAATPIAAAVGGMLFPALIYLWINWKSGMRDGVGIPMATDIAFAIGMLALLGKQVPVTLKIFLTALAIIDDLGAILFIAFFYSKEIHLEYLGIAGGILLVLSVLGRMKVYHLAFYLIPGIVVWYCFLKSGIHATIAGVLLAFAIPFGKDDASSPSYRLQHFLHKPVAFIILPIFALANTALVFEDGWLNDLASSNSMGIIAGLLAGKPVGILLFTFMVVKFGWGGLPEGVQWKQIVGTAFLAGIGFTMSIFISNLAFDYGENVQTSKMAILTGSLFACIAGLGILYFTTRRQKTGSG